MNRISESETLQEFVDSRGETVRLDRAASVLRGVKLLGLTSRNGRRYREDALRRAIPLYEGSKVNVNHPSGDPLAPRDYRDRLGVIRGVRLQPGEGLFGSLHYNPRHPLAEQLSWDAEHAPENVGFSHNVLARTTRDGAGLVVEAIEKVRSVDLVADPATTNGLFEHTVTPSHDWDQLTIDSLRTHRPDLLAEILEQPQDELEQQRQQINQLSLQAKAASRRERIHELLVEHGLPLPDDNDPAAARITSPAFLESLAVASDDDALRRLVVDRAEAIQEAAVKNTPIVAREQSLTIGHRSEPPQDAAAFVAAITRH